MVHAVRPIMSNQVERIYNKALTDIALTAANKVAQNAHLTKYVQHEDGITLLKSILCRDVIKAGTKESSHPIAAELLWVANQQQQVNRHSNCIEIGPDPRTSIGAAHWTFANTDGRDQARHLAHALAMRRRENCTEQQRTFAARVEREDGRCIGEVCLGGLENCQHVADEALAVHSLYDVEPRQIHTFMTNTRVKKITAVMHLPVELVLPNAPRVDYYQVVRKGPLLCMTFMNPDKADMSHAYAHNYDNWRRYLKDAYWLGPGFNILLEIVNWQGVQATLTLTKITKPTNIVRNSLPAHMESVRVPNFTHIVANRGVRDPDHDIILPKWIVNKTVSYLNTLPTQNHNLQAAQVYLRMQTTSMTIGTILRLQTWQPDCNVLMHAALNLYLVSLSMRMRQSNILDRTGKHLKSDSALMQECMDGWWLGMKLKLLRRSLVRWWQHRPWHPEQGQIVHELTGVEQWLHMYTIVDNRPPVDIYEIPANSGRIGEMCEPRSGPKSSLPWLEAYTHYLETLEQSDHAAAKMAHSHLLNFNPGSFKAAIDIVEGVPGSGKSRYIRQHYPDAYIVVPTNELKKDYPNHNVDTQHVALTKAHGHVVVDECYMLPLGYYAALQVVGVERITLVGDPRQIGFIDFDRMGDMYDLTKFDLPFQRVELTQTYRCPKDVTWLLRNNFGYNNITTNSTIGKSIRMVRGKPGAGLIGQMLVFTQVDKAQYPGSCTVHEFQGKTAPYVNLVVTQNARTLLNNSKSHLVTAITRHNAGINIYQDGLELAEFGVREITLLELEQVNLFPINNLKPVSYQEQVSSETEDKPPYGAMPEPLTLNDVLDKVTYGTIEHANQVTLVCMAPEERIKLHSINIREDKKQQWHVRGADYAHHTYVNDKVTTLTTLITRYAKLTFRPELDKMRLVINTLSERFKEAYLARPLQPVGETDEMTNLMEMLTAMHQRGTLDKAVYDDICDPALTVVDFHLKQQSKVKTASEYTLPGHLRGKAGQGISAWSKVLNLLLGTAVRSVQQSVANSLREDVVLAYNQSDIKVGKKFIGATNYCHTVESDITEFDCNQGPTTVGFEMAIWQEAGVDPRLCKLYTWIRSHWQLSAYHVATLYGHDKQHSGQPATLFGNSLVTMAIMSLCFDGLETAFCAFKGDDSIVLGDDVKPNLDGEQMNQDYVGLLLKLENDNVPQFINHFVTPTGLVPDYVRIAAKVCSKWFIQKPDHVRRTHKVTVVDNPIAGVQVSLSFQAAPQAALMLVDGLYRQFNRYYSDAVQDNCLDVIRLHYHVMTIASNGVTQLHMDYVVDTVKIRWVHIQSTVEAYMERFYVHQHSTSIKDQLIEYQRSIRDRLAVSVVESHREAIVAAAKYYNLKEEEVEAVHDSLRAMAHTTDPMKWVETRDNIPRVVDDIERRVDAIYALPQNFGRRIVKNMDKVNTMVRSVLKLDDFIDFTMHHHMVDISAAPGSFTHALRQKGYVVECWVYKGRHALPPNKRLLPKGTYKEYKNMIDIQLPNEPCHLISDASAVGGTEREEDRVKQTVQLMHNVCMLLNRLPEDSTFAVKVNCPFSADVRRAVDVFPGAKKVKRSEASTAISNEVIVQGVIDGTRSITDWGPALEQAQRDKAKIPEVEMLTLAFELQDAGTDGNDCFHRAYAKLVGTHPTREVLPTNRWLDVLEIMDKFNEMGWELSILVYGEDNQSWVMLTNGPLNPMVALKGNHFWAVIPGKKETPVNVVRLVNEKQLMEDAEQQSRTCTRPGWERSSESEYSILSELDVPESGGPGRPGLSLLPTNGESGDMGARSSWSSDQGRSDVPNWPRSGCVQEQQPSVPGSLLELIPRFTGSDYASANEQPDKSSRPGADVVDKRQLGHPPKDGGRADGTVQCGGWGAIFHRLCDDKNPESTTQHAVELFDRGRRRGDRHSISGARQSYDWGNWCRRFAAKSVYSEPGFPHHLFRAGCTDDYNSGGHIDKPVERGLGDDDRPDLFHTRMEWCGKWLQGANVGVWDSDHISVDTRSDGATTDQWSICGSDEHHATIGGARRGNDNTSGHHDVEQHRQEVGGKSHANRSTRGDQRGSASDQRAAVLPRLPPDDTVATLPPNDDQHPRHTTIPVCGVNSGVHQSSHRQPNPTRTDGRRHHGLHRGLPRPITSGHPKDDTGANRRWQPECSHYRGPEGCFGLPQRNCKHSGCLYPLRGQLYRGHVDYLTGRWAHMVALDGKMRSGFASLVPREHLRQFNMTPRQLGTVVTTITPGLTIHHLVTKPHTSVKPTTILYATLACQRLLERVGDQEVWLPAIGLGLDGLTMAEMCVYAEPMLDKPNFHFISQEGWECTRHELRSKKKPRYVEDRAIWSLLRDIKLKEYEHRQEAKSTGDEHAIGCVSPTEYSRRFDRDPSTRCFGQGDTGRDIASQTDGDRRDNRKCTTGRGSECSSYKSNSTSDTLDGHVCRYCGFYCFGWRQCDCPTRHTFHEYTL
uniref:RdRp n=1 Tax=Swiper virus TaxID=2803564 RepID=A0A7T8XNS7_9VIRU|nr:RdRp [Swiper virus]